MNREAQQEKRLTDGMRRGDRAAYSLLVDLYGGKILALARRYAACDADAEDIAQESLIEVCRSIGSFRGDAAFSTFLYRITLNRCLKYREREDRDRQNRLPTEHSTLPADERSDPLRQAERNELSRQLDRALDTLSDDHRDVVILHELQGLTYAECAAVLKIPEGTVKSRLFHAFRRLRDRLTTYVRDDVREEVAEKVGGEQGVTSRRVAVNGTTGGAL
ncbi:MAG: RNA polymerase sigma factor [Capsulimonadales bacterium]|nr:RNA polymerase sigma factor [Capsulimonadales bacterium]